MTITTNRAEMMDARQEAEASSANLEANLTLAAGAALTGMGVWRRGWFGAVLASGGAYLLYSGARDLRRRYQGSVRVAVTIGREREEIYRFVSDPQNWPRFLAALRIEQHEAGLLALGIGKPPKITIKSRFEITDHKPGEYVAWASDRLTFEHRGVIHFREATAGRGTEVSVALQYQVPAGRIAHSLASLVGWHPEQVVRESLRHLKQLLEAGEIPTTEGQPVGERGGKGAILRVLYRERPTEPAPVATRVAGD